MASRPSLFGAVLLAGCDDRLVAKPMAGRDGDMIRAGTLGSLSWASVGSPHAKLLRHSISDVDGGTKGLVL